MTEQNTEEKIIKAAEKVFIEKGLAGARMQEIADTAGINKSLLHYYYRSKEKLFMMVFQLAFKTFAPNIFRAFEGSDDLFTKIERFISAYLSIIERNPHIPGFVISELSNNPQRLIDSLSHLKIDFNPIIETIEKEIEKKTIKPIEPTDLIINILALCVFPIVAKPLVKTIIFKGSEEDYRKMLDRRKTEAARFVISAIKI
ncbi:MAG: TetR/AcrR family transcriptional regulator [Bacteroidota bacterium]|jgi:AcrR family transcriptional regulator